MAASFSSSNWSAAVKWFLIALSLALSSQCFGEDLSARDLAAFKKRLEHLVQAESKPRLGDLIEELSKYDDPRAYRLMLPAATLIPSAKNYELALDAIGAVEFDGVLEDLVSLASAKGTDIRFRVLVIDAFGRRRDEKTGKAIAGLLDDRDSRVAIAAVRALAERKERSSILPLIDLLDKLGKTRDRAWLETRHALLQLTGQDYESVEDWRKLWDTLPEDFDPKKLGDESGDARTQLKIKKAEDGLEFFGEEIYSRNLLFVIDVSGSMLMWDEDDSYSGTDAERELQRLNRAREQMYQAFRKLPRDARFNVIAYSDKVIPWKKSLQPASRSALSQAAKFVAGFQAKGATHTDDALKQAFDDLGVDTIVLLTDGAPTKQNAHTMKLIEDILEWVADTNAARKVRIDTFGFTKPGQWPDKIPGFNGAPPPPPGPTEIEVFVKFLKQLSESTGGTFRAIE